MAKKNDDLVRVLTLLPWWVNLSLAPLAYLLASRAAPAMLGDNALAPVFGPMFAYLGIALAAFFGAAAVASFVLSSRKRRLLDRQTGLDSIRALSWRQFEELVAEAFRCDGYRVVENDQPGPDGGVDIRLHRDGARHLVQCKNWRSQRVGGSLAARPIRAAATRGICPTPDPLANLRDARRKRHRHPRAGAGQAVKATLSGRLAAFLDGPPALGRSRWRAFHPLTGATTRTVRLAAYTSSRREVDGQERVSPGVAAERVA